MALQPPKTFLPRSLFGRALTILLVPIVVLQLVVGLVFFQRHYLRVTEQMTRSVAYELAYAVEQIEVAGDPMQAARRVAELALPLDLVLRLEPGATRRARGRARLLRHHRRQGRRRRFADASTGRSRSTCAATTAAARHRDPDRRRACSTPLVPRDRLSVSNPHQLLVLMILAAHRS